MIDTHCHLIDEAFAADAEACILRAQEAGIDRMMLACCDENEVLQIADLCQRHPNVLLASAGIHPENMASDVDAQLVRLKERCLSLPPDVKISAIGEIGIDLHWDKTRLDDQLHLLKAELDWAIEADLPVLLHIRDAMPEFLDFLRSYLLNNKYTNGDSDSRRLRGILHCYSGTVEEALQAFELADLLIGVGGTVTYKKSSVPDVVRAVGIQRIVLETDAPYLAPVPHRGKRNEPAYTADTARFVADLLGMSTEEVDSQTTCNAELLFGLKNRRNA